MIALQFRTAPVDAGAIFLVRFVENFYRVPSRREFCMSDDDDVDDENLDGDEEEEGDEDGYDDEDGERGADHDFSFDDETQGVLVAGKAFDVSGMLRKDLGAFAAHVLEVGKKNNLAISLTPSTDLSDDSGPGPEEDIYCTVHVGFTPAFGGTYSPDSVSRESCVKAIEEANAVPEEVWKEIGDKLREKERERYDEAAIRLHLTCVGPLAAATLAFGIPGTEDSEGPGEYMYGQDMGQEPHEEGIWGVNVAYVQYESPESEEVDMSDSAHAERMEKLGVDNGGYYLIARYD